MKSFFVSLILWSAYVVGLCLGLGFCLGVGTGLGYWLADAPLTGLLSGAAWWSFGYYATALQGYQRMVARIEAIKALA